MSQTEEVPDEVEVFGGTKVEEESQSNSPRAHGSTKKSPDRIFHKFTRYPLSKFIQPSQGCRVSPTRIGMYVNDV